MGCKLTRLKFRMLWLSLQPICLQKKKLLSHPLRVGRPLMRPFLRNNLVVYWLESLPTNFNVKWYVLEEYMDQDDLLRWGFSDNIEAFFTWHDIPERNHLRIAKAKFEVTTKLWQQNYKEEHRHMDTFRNWEDLNATLKIWFEPLGYRQGTHLHLTQL